MSHILLQQSNCKMNHVGFSFNTSHLTNCIYFMLILVNCCGDSVTWCFLAKLENTNVVEKNT